MYDLCQHFSSLPQAGGVLDQDPFLMMVMGLVAAARVDKQKADEAHQAAAQRAKGK